MAKVTQKDLKKFLEELNEEELRNEIKQLYQRFPIVKEYYQLELSTDSTAVVDDYKNKIRRYYFPTNRNIKKPKAAKMRELISQFKKVAPFPHDVIDLLLYQVETMMDFTEEKGYVTAGFYQTMVSRYKDATQLMMQEEAKEDFRERCQNILDQASFMSWGPVMEIELLFKGCFEEY